MFEYCIMERKIEVLRSFRLDARFFCVDDDGTGKATSDFARHVASRHIAIKGTDALLAPNFLSTIKLI